MQLAMPRQKRPPLTQETAQRVRDLVFHAARQYEVPPAYITAHVKSRVVHEARLHVWRVLIVEEHIPRTHVAAMFGRDNRRLRKNVLGF